MAIKLPGMLMTIVVILLYLSISSITSAQQSHTRTASTDSSRRDLHPADADESRDELLQALVYGALQVKLWFVMPLLSWFTCIGFALAFRSVLVMILGEQGVEVYRGTQEHGILTVVGEGFRGIFH